MRENQPGSIMTQLKSQTPPRDSRLVRYSPKSNDSPSRQLMKELEKGLNQIHLHGAELEKVRAFNRRSYCEDLDVRDLERTQADIAALEASAARHDAVRKDAEAALQSYIDAERRRQEEEDRIRREKEAREKAEREQKEREDAERQARIERERAEAAAKKAVEEKALAEAEEAQRKEREETAVREQAEKERLAKEASDREQAARAAAEDKAAKEAAAQKAAQAAQTQGLASSGSSIEIDNIHNRYVDLHIRLKAFRKDFVASAKTNPQLKSKVGDMRRDLKKSVGQLTDDKATNRKAVDRVKGAILESLKTIPSPPVKLSQWLLSPLVDESSTMPSLTLYLLNIFSKAVISSFAGECAVNPKAAEPIGTLAAQIFSLADLQFPLPNPSDQSPPPTISPVDILICKFHATAPHLFGIHTTAAAPPNTSKGRIRMGWRREDEPRAFVPEQRQLERLTGLGAGFASISLRNFARTRLKNPYPPHNFWASLASIVDTPAECVEAGHLVLLKNMIECGYERIVMFWGNVGVAAIREACLNWPARLPPVLRDSPAGRGLGLMVEGWAKDKEFRLI